MIINIALGIVLGVVLLYALGIALVMVGAILSRVAETCKELGEKFDRINGSQRFWRVFMAGIIALFILIALLNYHW